MSARAAHLRQEVDQVNGDDKIIIRNIETTDDGETIEIAIRQELLIGETVFEYWVTQKITGVRSIAGYGDLGDLIIDVLPGVNVNVEFWGGEGKTEFFYNGAGTASSACGRGRRLSARRTGRKYLCSAARATTRSCWAPAETWPPAAWATTPLSSVTPLSQGGLVFGGSDEGHNTFVVLAGENTRVD